MTFFPYQKKIEKKIEKSFEIKKKVLHLQPLLKREKLSSVKDLKCVWDGIFRRFLKVKKLKLFLKID